MNLPYENTADELGYQIPDFYIFIGVLNQKLEFFVKLQLGLLPQLQGGRGGGLPQLPRRPVLKKKIAKNFMFKMCFRPHRTQKIYSPTTKFFFPLGGWTQFFFRRPEESSTSLGEFRRRLQRVFVYNYQNIILRENFI